MREPLVSLSTAARSAPRSSEGKIPANKISLLLSYWKP
jgi:hypothetical protein